MDIKSFLSSHEFLSSLGDETLTALTASSVHRTFAGPSAIVKQGDKGERVWIIVDGEAEVKVCDDAGAECEVAVLHRGDLFGEMSIMMDEPSRASVYPRGNCEAVGISADAFIKYVKSDFRSMGKMTRTMVKRYSGLRDKKEK